jgi:hypothetical protein
MAKTLTQKNIRRNGNLAQGTVSFQVTGGGTLSGADFEFLAEDGVTTLTFVPRKIDLITNSETTAVVIDGKNFGPGAWNYHHFGGIPCGTSVVVGSGHITIQLRS